MENQDTILVVDSNHQFLKFINKILVEEGFNVETLDSAESVLDMLSSKQIDLIFLDISNSAINGLNLCECLKNNNAFKFIPIVLLSDSSNNNAVREGLALGAVDYLIKPFQEEELVIKINTQFRILKLLKQLNKKGGGQSVDKLVQKLNEELRRTSNSFKECAEELSEIKIKLEKIEEKDQLLLESAKDPIFIFNERGNILSANNAASKVYAYTKSELMELSVVQLITPNQRVKAKEINDYLKEHDSFSFNTMHKCKDGSVFPVEVESIKTTWNGKDALMSICRNNSDRDMAEQAIHKYLSLIDTANEFICVIQDGVFRFANKKLSQFLKLPVEEIIDRPFIEFVWPEDREHVLSNYKLRIAGEKIPESYDFRIIGPDGHMKWILFSATIIQWEGKPATINFLTDITERKKTVGELRRETALFDAVLNTTIDGILIVDGKGKKVLQNQKTVDLLKIPPEYANNIDDRNQLEYVISTTKNPKQFTEKVFHLYKHPEETSQDEVELKDGTVLDRYSAPVLGENGYNYGRIWIFRDITERKKSEENLKMEQDHLQRAKEKAEESDRLKTAFIQNMSHEIRTPLNAIMGFSKMFENTDLSIEKRREFSSVIINNSKQLLSIVTDILTISSIDTKQEKLYLKEFDLNEVFHELKTVFNGLAAQKNITLIAKSQLSKKQAVIFTDKIKITQILSNFISNAIKFTPKGFVEFGCQIKNSNLEFYIKDTGIGIEKKYQEKIFDRFYQADMDISRAYGGTGLGLSICKGLIELLEGKLWFDSEIKNGTTFYFTVPYKQVAEVSTDDTNTQNYSTEATILIVEDEEMNFLLLREQLYHFDVNLLYARNGDEAIAICKSKPNMSLVLMGINMPIMEGHIAARRIKELLPKLPIIAQTAYALSTEARDYNNVFDGYLTKPIEATTLIENIGQFIALKELNK